MNVFLILIAAALFLALLFVVFVPKRAFTLFAPFSPALRNMRRAEEREKLYEFFLDMYARSEDGGIDYAAFDLSFFLSYFRVKRVVLYLFDNATSILYRRYETGASKTTRRNTARKTDDTSIVPLNDLNDLRVGAFVQNKRAWVERERRCIFPLSYGDHAIGVIDVERAVERPFSEEETRNIEFFIALVYHLENDARMAELKKRESASRERQTAQAAMRFMHEEEELIRKARLSALGQMARGLAHEIKNPIATIHLILSDPQEIGQREIEIVQKEIARLDRLVSQFLSFARTRRYRFVETNVGTLIGEAAALFEKELRDRAITLVVQGADALPLIEADPDALTQVFINLIDNAVDAVANAEKREITIATKTRVTESGKKIEIVVHDEGEGIREEKLPHVFDPFFTDKPKGSGLGLAISHNIVSEHGGTISAGNHYRGGAVFEIALPLTDAVDFSITPMREEDIRETLAFIETIPEISVTERSLRHYLKNETDYRVTLIRHRESIIGYLALTVIPPEAQILDVAVHERFRKRGYGSRALEDAERALLERGVDHIFLEMRNGDACAAAFYARMGYTKTGERKEYYGEGRHACIMRKDLDKR